MRLYAKNNKKKPKLKALCNSLQQFHCTENKGRCHDKRSAHCQLFHIILMTVHSYNTLQHIHVGLYVTGAVLQTCAAHWIYSEGQIVLPLC